MRKITVDLGFCVISRASRVRYMADVLYISPIVLADTIPSSSREEPIGLIHMPM